MGLQSTFAAQLAANVADVNLLQVDHSQKPVLLRSETTALGVK